MTLYQGVAALSPFRQKKLLKQLQQLDPNITNVTAEYVHFVNAKKPLTKQASDTLAQLLTYGEPFAGSTTGEQLVVVPRPGTISPWSSKATDIAKNSGLDIVERIERGTVYYVDSKRPVVDEVAGLLHDRMTEAVLGSLEAADTLFTVAEPAPLVTVPIMKNGKAALEQANTEMGLALAQDEIDYLYDSYKALKRDPTDVELMMFGAVNSEHCRHKIFNAEWYVDGRKQPKSLFKMIKNTYEKNSDDVLSAYSDNAAVLRGAQAARFAVGDDKTYSYNDEPANLVIKVETHNHPTAIAPHPGAATGIGGEIRDEGATGRGARSKMGLSGFSVSNLYIPGFKQPWENVLSKPPHIASALDIMIDAPLGGAAFSNEFGRPNLTGYFRTFEQPIADSADKQWGYHKPIMVAGGLGVIRDQFIEKGTLPVGAKVIVLGGPTMLIGLGGGAASSMQTGESDEKLDFASVQRANPEMERRAQEVISTCVARGSKNPIITIHDIGAGGLSNGLPELVHDSGLGAEFEIRDVLNDDPSMSPMEIWCNESQERYVLGVAEKDLEAFAEICERERCPFAVVGTTTKKEQLVVKDRHFGNSPVDIPMSLLFGKPPKMTKKVTRAQPELTAFDTADIAIEEAVERVLHVPSVGSKKFLITIGDRTVGGLTVRDQMVGPWQVPVSDVAVTAAGFGSKTGEAMAMGERTPLAVVDGPASARIAIGETITNMAAANITKLSDIKLSANWMAASKEGMEDQRLFDTVKAVGEEFCPALGLTIPVGKDSLSMRTVWEDDGDKSVTSPLSLLISGFAPVVNVAHTLTPELVMDKPSALLFIDLGQGNTRMGGSALAQAYGQVGDTVPDIEAPVLAAFFKTIQTLASDGLLLAYHDRSDGGLFTTIAEMAFAARSGVALDISTLPGTALEKLFNEELGAVIQVEAKSKEKVLKELNKVLKGSVHEIGQPRQDEEIIVTNGDEVVYQNSRAQLEQWWAETSYRIQALRDNQLCAEEEYAAISDAKNTGLFAEVTAPAFTSTFKDRPKIAIFREQGVNGQVEMAAAFDRAGFTSVDVHLNDLVQGTVNLDDFAGLVACGGFSYGDVLGAGEGWAKTILLNKKLRTMFTDFFARPDTFTLGVCNGCQMLSALKELIPGAEHWPRFLKNTSEQFEARVAMVKVEKSPSIFFSNMEGSCLPVPVAHGEGRAEFTDSAARAASLKDELVPLRYVDASATYTEMYPANPNGSADGITALTSTDGRATIMMPHPERAFLTQQYSWHPTEWEEDGPWLRIFQNARAWYETHNKD